VVGQPISIKGKHLAGVTDVSFNTTPASSFRVKGNTLTAVVAPGTTSGPVYVTTGTGTAQGPPLIVDPSPVPTITSFGPKKAKVGKRVTVKGTGFWGTSAVRINGADVASFTVKSATRLTLVVAAGNSTGAISLATPGGSATSTETIAIP
jgi:hypothetical protein